MLTHRRLEMPWQTAYQGSGFEFSFSLFLLPIPIIFHHRLVRTRTDNNIIGHKAYGDY